MKVAALLALTLVCWSVSFAQQPAALANPNIDMQTFLRMSADAAKHRETRRLTEDEFIKMAAEKGTIILDARSREKYDELHIRNAVNLSFPDITVDSLASLLPDKNTRILIYCNNNFQGATLPFPTKMAAASLNLSTYIALYTYGYRNIYELGPLLDIQKTKLELIPTPKPAANGAATDAVK
jgi:hypothetical protein